MSESPFADFSDEKLLTLLRQHEFRGPIWERYVEVLADHGVKTIASWIVSKRIFREMYRRRFFCCGPVVIDWHDAVDLAVDVVIKAIEPYRKLLMDGWDPHGRASLESAFIDGCLRQFPNQYRRWLHSTLGLQGEKIVDLPGDDEVAQWHEERAHLGPSQFMVGDPEALLISRQRQEELLSLLPDNLRAVVQLVMQGFTFRDAAAAHGLDDKKLRKQLHRLRPRLWRLWAEHNRETDS
jgi:DNA-directed RNA polymerase specialized sigma24 family protein